MTTSQTHDEVRDTVYWLTIAGRVLSGEIDPHHVSEVLRKRRRKRDRPRIVKPSVTEQ